MNTNLNAFDSFNGSYDSSGDFNKTIKIPKKNWTSGRQAVLLKPETVVARENISSRNTYAILEIVQHGHPYYDSLASESLEDVSQNGDLTTIIPGFDPSKGRDVRVITIHDEDYASAPDAVKQQIIEMYANYIATCGYNTTGNCNASQVDFSGLLIAGVSPKRRPRTLGNGIMKP